MLMNYELENEQNYVVHVNYIFCSFPQIAQLSSFPFSVRQCMPIFSTSPRKSESIEEDIQIKPAKTTKFLI